MHCWWTLPSVPLRRIDVVCEVAVPPAVDALYFWALQATFVDDEGRDVGGAHLGLQWYTAHPGATAVNFGGYGADGRELAGTASALPSATGNPNTRDFAWRPATAYRLTIDGRAGSVTDVGAGATTPVRSLHAPGTTLRAPVVWSEVFARCDDPPTVVRWSDLSAVTVDGDRVAPTSCTATYQGFADGGCTNTDTVTVGDAIEQRTGVARTTPHDTLLRQPLRP